MFHVSSTISSAGRSNLRTQAGAAGISLHPCPDATKQKQIGGKPKSNTFSSELF